MCGITGILQIPRAPQSADLAVIGQMTARLRHRGPDADGSWCDRDAGIALGHRRLAIVDLTDAGRQPMTSRSGRFVITFNGEIYNYLSLRQELERCGQAFIGSGDTEVLLAMIERWGLETALRRSNGMFAIGVWDRKTRILHLARDRMGKKPLYVARTRNAVAFASELKAIAAFPEFVPEINPHAVAEFLGRGWLPDDHCIWQGVFKLPPGSILSFGAGDLPALRDAAALRKRANSWWSLIDVARKGRAEPVHADDSQLVSELDHLLRQAVGERMVADVPIGLFLSGGIDSSTVVALMQSQSTRPVRTFTIGFGERAFNEAANATEVAQHLGTDHTELLLTPAEARAVIPELPQIWDEPFADESQIPALLLSRLARRDVTVALSGDGGDECFGGYSRHILTARLAPLLNSNRAIRRMAALGVTLLARGLRESVVDALPVADQFRRTIGGDRVNRLAQLLGGDDVDEMYRQALQLSELRLTPQTTVADSGEVAAARRSAVRLHCERHARLFAWRHSGEARSRQHGDKPGSALPNSRPSSRGICLAAAEQSEGAGRPGQMDPASGPRPVPAPSRDRSAQAGLRRPDRRLVERAVAIMGRRLAVRVPTTAAEFAGCAAHPELLARASKWPP